jgi:hypothetical protein
VQPESWWSDRPFRGSEAIRAGRLTRAELRGPAVRRVAYDTYVLASVPDTPRLAIRVAATWAGADAVITGWSACRWWGCEVLPAPDPAVEVSVPQRHRCPPPGVAVRRCRIRAVDLRHRGGVRVTSPLRTAYDLSCSEPLADAVMAADALGRAWEFTGSGLEAIAGLVGPRRNCRRVTQVAHLMDPASESPRESRTRVRIVLAGLPVPVVQYVVLDGRRFVARVDLAWPEWKVALEYDGHDHALEDRRGHDVDRIDELRRLGWVVITVTSRQFARPGWIESRVHEELAARGAL